MSKQAVVVEVTRGPIVESRHEGIAAVMKADGSEQKVITSKHEHTLARWAPDGKSLSYVRSEKGQPPALWVSDADGRNAKELLGGVGKWAAEWKPK